MSILLVFENTHSALAAEDILRSRDIRIELLPTPRGISASCGISIKADLKYLSQIKTLLEKGPLRVQALYQVSLEDNTQYVQI